jgi:hypothetical protein
MVAVMCTVASVALAGVAADRKSGPCAFGKNGEKKMKFELGKALKAKCEWEIDDFFDKKTIMAGATIKNPTSKPMFYRYYVAVFDAKGNLIGAAGQGSFGNEGLAPGEEEHLASCLIMLPEAMVKQVAKYQVVLYESDKPVGKE